MKKTLILVITTLLSLVIFTNIKTTASGETVNGGGGVSYGWNLYGDGYEYYYYDSIAAYQSPVFIEFENPLNYQIEYGIATKLSIPYATEYIELSLDPGSYLKIEVLYDYEVAEEAGGICMYYQKLTYIKYPNENLIATTPTTTDEDNWYFIIRRKMVPLQPPEEPPAEIITTPLEELPLTAQTPFSTDVGRVFFYPNGYNLVVQIHYNNVYYLKYNFDIGTDMDIFNATEAYYLNTDGTPSIFINNSEFLNLLDILQAPEDEKPAFVPHSIWDLKTNEIKTISEYKVLAYVKQMQAGPIVAYTYIDQFIMDKMISIQVSWTDRQENGWPMKLWQKYTKWEQHIETYTADDYLMYRNLYTNWEHLIPVWQFIRLGIQGIVINKMPRIDSVNWNNIQPEYNITKNEVESYFSKMDEDFVALKTNPRFKTWAIALQGGKNSDVGFAKTQIYHNEDDLTDPMNFHIVHITYETNGKLYETVGDHMDLRITIHQDLLPDEKSNKLMSLIVLIFVVVLFFAAFKAKAFSSPKKAVSFIIGTIIIIIFAYIAYHLLLDSSLLDNLGV